MSRWDKVEPERRERIFAYNRQRAVDSEGACDMRKIAIAIGKLPKGQMKKILTDDIKMILAKYGVEV